MFDGICSIGSAHIDIIARPSATSYGVDRRGKVTISVGGTAYNVACNLRWLGSKVALVTVVKDSIWGHIITEKLKSFGIATDWVVEDHGINESAFVAVLNGSGIDKAVNSLAIGEYIFPRIPISDLYFLDLNNSIETIKTVLNYGKVVCIGLVSEEKATKLCKALSYNSNPIRYVSGNNHEYKAILNSMGLSSMKELSEKYKDTEFVYTMGEKGFQVWQNGEIVATEKGIDVKSKQFQGAGDALIAAYLTGRHINGYTIKESASYALQHAVKEKLKRDGTNLMEDNILKGFYDLVLRDRLTGMFNRHYYEHYTKRNSSYWLILADIDHFKSINDTYGHDAGDYIIKEFCFIIKSALRSNDKVIRWGGEEFLLIIEGIESDRTVYKLTERIRQKVQQHTFWYSGQEIRVTASFGVCKVNGNPKEAIIEADRRLYIAKTSGRNKVVF